MQKTSTSSVLFFIRLEILRSAGNVCSRNYCLNYIVCEQRVLVASVHGYFHSCAAEQTDRNIDKGVASIHRTTEELSLARSCTSNQKSSCIHELEVSRGRYEDKFEMYEDKMYHRYAWRVQDSGLCIIHGPGALCNSVKEIINR